MTHGEALVMTIAPSDHQVKEAILQETPNNKTTRSGLSTAPRKDRGFRFLLIRL